MEGRGRRVRWRAVRLARGAERCGSGEERDLLVGSMVRGRSVKVSALAIPSSYVGKASIPSGKSYAGGLDIASTVVGLNDVRCRVAGMTKVR